MIINCPECNTKISDKAKSCPKCGYPIWDEEKYDLDESKKENIYSVISLLFFVLFIISGFMIAVVPCVLFYITSKIFAFIAYGKEGGTKCADIVYSFNKIVIIVFLIIIFIKIAF